MDVSSVQAPTGRPNGPPPTMSVTGGKLPRGWNSTVVPTASPHARPSRQPRYRFNEFIGSPPTRSTAGLTVGSPGLDECELTPFERVVLLRQFLPPMPDLGDGLFRRSAVPDQVTRRDGSRPPVAAPTMEVDRHLPDNERIDCIQNAPHSRPRRGGRVTDRIPLELDGLVSPGGELVPTTTRMSYGSNGRPPGLDSVRLHQIDHAANPAVDESPEFFIP